MSFHQTMPRLRREKLIVQELDGETLVYDLDRDKAHCLNPSAAFVWSRCDGRTSIASVARELHAKFDLPEDEQIVIFALATLSKSWLLEPDSVETSHDAFGGVVGRRALIRKLGIAAGIATVAIPAIASIVSPPASLAATGCSGVGQPCSGTVLCCPGLACNFTVTPPVCI